MKWRWKLLLLSLPVVVGVLMWGVKWRVEHPTASGEALRVRTLLLHCPATEVSHVLWVGQQIKETKVALSEAEFKPFIDCFYLLPQASNSNSSAMGTKGVVTISRDDKVATVVASISLDRRVGEVLITRPGKARRRSIHSVTVKRWIELLLANPRIGPELRAHLAT